MIRRRTTHQDRSCRPLLPCIRRNRFRHHRIFHTGQTRFRRSRTCRGRCLRHRTPHTRQARFHHSRIRRGQCQFRHTHHIRPPRRRCHLPLWPRHRSCRLPHRCSRKSRPHRTRRRRPHPPHKGRHKLPEHRADCHRNRNRFLGCQNIHTRRSHLVRSTRCTRLQILRILLLCRKCRSHSNPLGSHPRKPQWRPTDCHCSRSLLREWVHIHIRKCHLDRCTPRKHRSHQHIRQRHRKCRLRLHPRGRCLHTHQSHQVGCRRNRNLLQGCPHNRIRRCRQGRCRGHTHPLHPRIRPHRRKCRLRPHLPRSRRRTRQPHLPGCPSNRSLPRGC